MSIQTHLQQFARDEGGVTMIEYALLAGLISIVAITAITAASGSIKTIWDNIKTALSGAATASGG